MGEREDRIARNEALFRELNERVEGINRFLDPETEEASFICECGDADCMERVRMTMQEYEAVRKDGTLFLVLVGHEAPDVEDVVDLRDGWCVVRKKAGADEIALEFDPRS